MYLVNTIVMKHFLLNVVSFVIVIGFAPHCCARLLTPGQSFPTFYLSDITGKTIDDSVLASNDFSIVYLFSVACKFCYKDLVNFQNGKDHVIAISDNQPNEIRRYIADLGVEYSVLIDSTKLINQLGASNVRPITYIVSKKKEVLSTIIGGDKALWKQVESFTSSYKASIALNKHVFARNDFTDNKDACARRFYAKLPPNDSGLCDVVELLIPLQEKNINETWGLEVVTSKHDNHFFAGENLSLTLTAPKYEAYIYVDYYMLDGHVVHLLPNILEQDNKSLAQEKKFLGIPNENLKLWKIEPPFGQELITVISSLTPLFPNSRSEVELTKDYVQTLQRLFAVNNKLLGAFVIIRTEALSSQ